MNTISTPLPHYITCKMLLLSVPGVLRWKEENRWMHLQGVSLGGNVWWTIVMSCNYASWTLIDQVSSWGLLGGKDILYLMSFIHTGSCYGWIQKWLFPNTIRLWKYMLFTVKLSEWWRLFLARIQVEPMDEFEESSVQATTTQEDVCTSCSAKKDCRIPYMPLLNVLRTRQSSGLFQVRQHTEVVCVGIWIV